MSSDDRVNELFPKRTGFWMALKGVLNRKHHIARDGDAMASKVPVSVLIVDDNKGRLIGRR